MKPHPSTFTLALLLTLTLPTLAQEARQPIKLDPAIYDAYVGQYEQAPNIKIILRRTRERLTAQIGSQPPFEVLPESQTRFFWKLGDARFTIQKDAQDKVTGLLLERGTFQSVYKKVSSEPPQELAMDEPEAVPVSPRLKTLAKELKAGNKEALGRFWKEMHDKGPLIEAIPGITKHTRVTYIWRRNDKTQRVFVSGGLPTVDDKPLTRLAGTDLWYLTERLPSNARFAYHFIVNRPATAPADLTAQMNLLSQYPLRTDPLNPREISIQSMVMSLLELPGAPPQPYITPQQNVPKGALHEHTIKSELLKQDRTFTVYTPAGYEAKDEPLRLLILFDGDFYQSHDEIPGPTILDNLMAARKIPPMIAVFIHHKFRNGELSCSEPFANHLAKEMVPWLRQNYRATNDPQQTIVGGLSLGGLMSSFCGLRHPTVFGNVLSQSGSYQWFPGMVQIVPVEGEPGWLTRQFVQAPLQPVKFYLEAGLFEDGFPMSLLAENRRFRDVLQAKGYTVHYAEFTGGHDYLSWRGGLADGLMHLLGTPLKK